MDKNNERYIEFDSIEHAMNLFGSFDENVKIIEETLNVRIIQKNDGIRILGAVADSVEKAGDVVKKLIVMAEKGETVTRQSVNYLIELAMKNRIEDANEYMESYICLTARGKQIKPKTNGQKNYINAIKNNTIVFGIGPAGTGKTFLGVAMAVKALKDKDVNRIIITRPAVEAGERLGFLPGDLQNKVDPYLRPLYDALYEIMGTETYQKYIDKGVIEIAPLAYMRGRTLDDSFIILDEAQNTSPEQMKMFLTRIGFGSKVVVTGDITQIDLPGNRKSGLKEVLPIFKNIRGIEFIYLTDIDVIRHELVRKIIKAYEKHDKNIKS